MWLCEHIRRLWQLQSHFKCFIRVPWTKMALVGPSCSCHAWKRQIRMLLAWAKGTQPLFSGASIQPKDGAQLDRKTGQIRGKLTARHPE